MEADSTYPGFHSVGIEAETANEPWPWEAATKVALGIVAAIAFMGGIVYALSVGWIGI